MEEKKEDRTGFPKFKVGGDCYFAKKDHDSFQRLGTFHQGEILSSQSNRDGIEYVISYYVPNGAGKRKINGTLPESLVFASVEEWRVWAVNEVKSKINALTDTLVAINQAEPSC